MARRKYSPQIRNDNILFSSLLTTCNCNTVTSNSSQVTACTHYIHKLFHCSEHFALWGSFRRTCEILIHRVAGKVTYSAIFIILYVHNFPTMFSVGSLIGQVCVDPRSYDATVFCTNKAAQGRPCTSYRLGGPVSIITELQLGLVSCQRRLNVMAHPTTARGRARTTFINIYNTQIFHSFLFHPTNQIREYAVIVFANRFCF